jgi:hypothetical protein
MKLFLICVTAPLLVAGATSESSAASDQLRMAHEASGKRTAAASIFDGKWSVFIVTKKGSCDREIRWGVGVVDNRIVDVGDAGAAVSGTVAPSGRIAAHFAIGPQMLMATGQLIGAKGSGLWTAPALACSGSWRAEKQAQTVAGAV